MIGPLARCKCCSPVAQREGRIQRAQETHYSRRQLSTAGYQASVHCTRAHEALGDKGSFSTEKAGFSTGSGARTSQRSFSTGDTAMWSVYGKRNVVNCRRKCMAMFCWPFIENAEWSSLFESELTTRRRMNRSVLWTKFSKEGFWCKNNCWRRFGTRIYAQ